MPVLDHVIPTADGDCSVTLHLPDDGPGPWPAVILFPDAGGVRDTMRAMADRLAATGEGYAVLLPDVYHRTPGWAPFDVATAFGDADERARLMGMVKSVTAAMYRSDVDAWLDFLSAATEVSGEAVGTTGYCMGGRASLIVASHRPDRITATASFHGGGIASAEDPDSPHLRAGDIRSTVLVAGATDDGSFDDAARDRLDKALTEAGVTHTIETYPAAHGFAVPDNPTFDETAAARHWTALETLLAEALPARDRACEVTILRSTVRHGGHERQRGVDVTVLLLLAAGVAAGLSGSVAGLASLFSYPALLAVGLPATTANVTNTVALAFSTVGQVAGSRPELTGQWAVLRRFAPITLVGGATGAALVLVTPPEAFERIVPFLVGGAAVVLLFQPRIRAAAARRGTPDAGPTVLGGMFLVAVYGGYFGAAAGVLMLALVLIGLPVSLARGNALKAVLLGVANAVAAVGFVLLGVVAWWAVPPLAVGVALGGWVGPAVVRRLPAAPLRVGIALAGLGLAVGLAVQAY